MRNIRLVKFSMWLASSTFWTSVLVLFLESRGLSLSEVYQLISIYSIGIVLLEYPTGVIGDYFSHRMSIIMGYLISGSGLVLLGLFHGYYTYLFLMVYLALGWSLSSGSDNALLHSVSDNFKKDFADTRSVSLIFRMIAISLGSFIATYSLALPAILTGIFLAISATLLLFVKEEKKIKEKGDIFALARQGILDLRKNKQLRSLVIINSVIAGFFISYKWFFNPMFEEIELPLELWGVMISFATLAQAFGAKIVKRFKNISLNLIFAITMVVIVFTGIYNSLAITLAAVMGLFLLRGVIETELTININEHVNAAHRAGTQSLSSLISRMFSGLYLVIAGYILELTDIFMLMVISVVIIVVFLAGFLYSYSAESVLDE